MPRLARLLALALLCSLLVAAAGSDDEPPTVSLASGRYLFGQDTVAVAVYASDQSEFHGGTGVAAITAVLDGVVHELPSEDGEYGQRSEYAEAELALHDPPPVVELCVTATDTAGNVSPSECKEIATTDDEPPRVIDFMSDYVRQVDRAITVGAILADGRSSIANAVAIVNGQARHVANVSDGEFDELTENVNVNIGKLPEGTHDLCWEITDAAGNVNDPDPDLPRDCTTLRVADVEGPAVYNLEVTPETPGVGQLVRLQGIVDERVTGRAAITSAEVSVAGGTPQIIEFAGDAVLEDLDTTFVAPQPDRGLSWVCVAAVDALDNRSNSVCEVFEVVPRTVEGSATIRSVTAGDLGADGSLVIDVEDGGQDPPVGSFTYREDALEFTSTRIDELTFTGGRADVRSVDLAGVGLLNGAVECSFNLAIEDRNSPVQDSEAAADTAALEITDCGGAADVGSSSGSILTGDLHVRA